jgi:hypothetical protein
VDLFIELHRLLAFNGSISDLENISQYFISSLALFRGKSVGAILQKSNYPFRFLLIYRLQLVVLLHYILQLLVNLTEHTPHGLAIIILSSKYYCFYIVSPILVRSIY